MRNNIGKNTRLATQVKFCNMWFYYPNPLPLYFDYLFCAHTKMVWLGIWVSAKYNLSPHNQWVCSDVNVQIIKCCCNNRQRQNRY